MSADMLMADRLAELITWSFQTHDRSAKLPRKRFRKFDGCTPYAVHPTWCAMMILHETSLSEELRVNGAQALLFHDILEDTTRDLPAGTPFRVRELVEGLTFESMDDEMVRVWERPPVIRLLKMYDKVSNYYTDDWMEQSRIAQVRPYLRRLTDDVKANYGRLSIIRFADQLLLPHPILPAEDLVATL